MVPMATTLAAVETTSVPPAVVSVVSVAGQSAVFSAVPVVFVVRGVVVVVVVAVVVGGTVLASSAVLLLWKERRKR